METILSTDQTRENNIKPLIQTFYYVATVKIPLCITLLTIVLDIIKETLETLLPHICCLDMSVLR